MEDHHRRDRPRGDDEILLAIRQNTYWMFRLRNEVRKMREELDTLTREVSEISDVIDSAKALIAGLAELIRANINNKAELLALASRLDAKEQELAVAVAAGTPAEEPAS